MFMYARRGGGWTTRPGTELFHVRNRPETPSVPGEHGLRLAEDERRPPTTPRCDSHPRAPIRRGQTKSRGARAIQDRQLIPEREALEVRSRAQSSGWSRSAKTAKRQRRPRVEPFNTESNFNQRIAYDVAGRHRPSGRAC